MDTQENKIRAIVFNNTDGARQIYTTSGRKSIASKQRAEVEMTEAEFRSASTNADLTLAITDGKLVGKDPVGGAAKVTPEKASGSATLKDADLEGMTKAQLADLIEKRDGTRPHDSVNRTDLLDMAKNKPA